MAFVVDPSQGLLEEDIGAIAFGRDELAVVIDHRVEILVARRIAAGAGIGLPDAAAAVDEHLVEAALVGPILGFVAEMPLAEHPGRVAGLLEHRWQRHRIEPEPFAFEDRVRDAVVELMAAGLDRRTGRRARRAHMKISEARACLCAACRGSAS